MARACTVCSHPNRDKIDEALLHGTSIRDIAGRYDLAKSAVDRHRSHIGTALAEAKERQAELEMGRSDSLLDTTRRILREAEEMVRQAKAEGRQHVALGAMDRVLKAVAVVSTLMASPAGQPTRITVKWMDACPHPCAAWATKELTPPPVLALPPGANGQGDVIDVTPIASD